MGLDKLLLVRRAVSVACLLPMCCAATSPEGVEPKQAKTSAEQASPAAMTPAQRERKFTQMLSGVVFDGIWQVTGAGGLKADQPLSEPKKERYSIVNVSKAADDFWVVNARMEFGDTDVTVPILVRVVWAGDTPVITLDDYKVPMVGEYSARVMIHEGFYSGVWYSRARNYGGVLAGRIVREKQDKAASPPKEPK